MSKHAERRHRDIIIKKKAERIWNIHKNRFYHPFGYFPVDKYGNYEDDDEKWAYFKRYKSSSKYRSFLKRQSNKRIRNSDPETLYNGGEYRRLYDYWWELY